MNAMTLAALSWVRRGTAMSTLGLLIACQKQEPEPTERPARAMDGLERYTARTVSIETAIEAMHQRDAKKLKMLGVWVRKRDKTALLNADDLSSLDLAVECIESNPSNEQRIAALERIKSGKLKAAARDVCLTEQD
jgi:hypothetical protein